MYNMNGRRLTIALLAAEAVMALIWSERLRMLRKVTSSIEIGEADTITEQAGILVSTRQTTSTAMAGSLSRLYTWQMHDQQCHHLLGEAEGG